MCMDKNQCVKALVVDDSALFCKTITNTLALDLEIEVVYAAYAPLIAQRFERFQPEMMNLNQSCV